MTLSFEMNKEALSRYLIESAFMLPDDEVIAVEKPGEGNMNFVARVVTRKQSLILKQANAFVQKYPQISAPVERSIVEAEFYETVKNTDFVASSMPAFLGIDTANHIIALEDVGNAVDFTFVYRQGYSLNPGELEQLIAYLNALHQIPHDRLKTFPQNLALRKLNNEHLFHYPFMPDNGFDLNTIQPGLQEISRPYKSDTTLIREVRTLGDVYLSQGSVLLQGDYYPGSWLKTEAGVTVIDPEFSFIGRREFDMGVFIAHLMMSVTVKDGIDVATSAYLAGPEFDWHLCHQFMGVEIMRRIMGLAQLPLDLSLVKKQNLLEEAYKNILG
jgi:5-methylthioribose kinase